jgi:hypothetical protein
MKTIILAFTCLSLCLPTFGKNTDISQTIALDRSTLLDGATFTHDTGFLYADGTFHVVTSDIEYYSFYGLIPADIAPVSGKPLMDETLYNSYHNLGLIPKWIASSFEITIGFETFVIVGVKGKNDVGVAVTITQQPQSTSSVVGSFADFSVQAEPSQYLSYQWYCNSKPLPGETFNSLFVADITTKQGGVYKCAVSSGGTPLLSQGALLTVITPATIKKQPANIKAKAGKKATFSVVALGTGPLHYQWHKNIAGDDTIPNATNSTYTIPAVQPADAGGYFVTVQNEGNSALSRLVTLAVTP